MPPSATRSRNRSSAGRTNVEPLKPCRGKRPGATACGRRPPRAPLSAATWLVDRGLLRLLLGRNARVNRGSTSPLASLPSSHREGGRTCPPPAAPRRPRSCVRPRGSRPGTPRADASPTCASERMPCESRSPAASCADTLHPSTLVSRKRRIPARPPGDHRDSPGLRRHPAPRSARLTCLRQVKLSIAFIQRTVCDRTAV